MKKAKFLLASIAIFAVVGGALAFKAKQFGNVYCGNTCDDLRLGFTTVNQQRGIATTVCNQQGTNMYFINGAFKCTSTSTAYVTDQ